MSVYSPPTTIVEPPIKTNSSLLPIEKLSWEDFEKLCLRIVQSLHKKEACEIYGIKGQKQEGIDIFAYKGDKYSSFQCKRYETVSEDDLNNAVEKFKEGKWIDKSDEFVFCTSFAIEKTQLQDTFNRLREDLLSLGIDFIKWGKNELSELLKDKPQIVYDFFGREWVREFNGEDYLNLITEKRKLDVSQVAKYRKKLHDFYQVAFNNYDPSIPASNIGELIPIRERFVPPDFIEKREITEYTRLAGKNSISENEQYRSNEIGNLRENTEQQRQNRIISHESEIRVKIDTELPKSQKSVILGEPGSGKSTLLRNIILDLLSDELSVETLHFENISMQWGELLPLWLPFAYITKNLSINSNLSLVEIVELWLKSNDMETMTTLVKDALNDERLLLFIDGIDEWADFKVAELAISKIEIHSKHKNSIVVYSSRPYGYRLLKNNFNNFKLHTIASFSKEQQKKYLTYWYGKWAVHKNETESSYIENQIQNFFSEVEKSDDLLLFSGNPLLLSILISQRLQNSVLPKNKVALLEEITDYLIKTHPNKRKTSANILDDAEYDFSVYDALAVLAMRIHEDYHDGIILKEDAHKILTKYIREETDCDKATAKKASEDFLNIGANNIGIIIEKSSSELAFMHRQFQEFMAAKYLKGSDKEEVVNKLKKIVHQPEWEQVIMFFFGLSEPRKKSEFKDYLDLIKSHETYYSKVLRYSLGITLPNAPKGIAKSYLSEFISWFEYETNFEKKEEMWNVLLMSLFNPKVKEAVLEFFFSYFPNKNNYRDKRIQAIGHISNSQVTSSMNDFLIKSLINGNTYQKLDASTRIQHLMSEQGLLTRIRELLKSCYNPEILGYLINTFVSGSITEEIKQEIFHQYENSEHPTVYLFVMKLKVNLQIHTDNDLNLFIEKQKDTDYELREEVESVLVDGWGNSNLLYQTLINAPKKLARESVIPHELVWRVLFRCFSSRHEVISLVNEEFKNEEYLFSHMHGAESWKLFSDGFKGVAGVNSAIEVYLDKDNQFREIETSFACLACHTDKAKQYLLQELPNSDFSHWQTMALIEGWGTDKDVIDSLKQYFKSNNNKKGRSASYISKVFADDIPEGIRVAEEILFHPNIRAHDRALNSLIELIELDKQYFEENILEKFLEKEINSFKDDVWGTYYEVLFILIRNFPNHEHLKELAKENLEKLPRIIEFYPELIDDFEGSLQKSLPISEKFRLKLMYELNQRYFSDLKITNQLSLFLDDESTSVRIASAIAYFQNIKSFSPEKVLNISNELVFFRGTDYEVQRQIAFFGYLILGSLDEYFLMEDTSKYLSDKPLEDRLANPHFDFSEYRIKDNTISTEFLIKNFDYVFEATQGNLNKLTEVNNLEDTWGHLAKYSFPESETTKHILKYIENKKEEITNIELISFLKRVPNKSSLLKEILIRNINSNNEVLSIHCGYMLGTLFNSDKEVEQIVSRIENISQSYGKIMALCQGWSESDILQKTVDDIITNELMINSWLAYALRFLFSPVEEVKKSLEELLNNYHRSMYDHTFFFPSLVKRLEKDEDLRAELKELLLNANTVSEKISYYSLLNIANDISEKINIWKEGLLNTVNVDEYGYNITTNKVCSINQIFNSSLR